MLDKLRLTATCVPLQVLLRLGWACTVLATALLTVEAVVKFGNHQNYLLQHNSIQYVNVVVASAGLAALLPTAALLFGNCYTAGRVGKQWTSCRRRIVILASAEVVLQIINLVRRRLGLTLPAAHQAAVPAAPHQWVALHTALCSSSAGTQLFGSNYIDAVHRALVGLCYLFALQHPAASSSFTSPIGLRRRYFCWCPTP